MKTEPLGGRGAFLKAYHASPPRPGLPGRPDGAPQPAAQTAARGCPKAGGWKAKGQCLSSGPLGASLLRLQVVSSPCVLLWSPLRVSLCPDFFL